MRGSNSIWAFVLGVPAWFIAFTLLWMQISAWTSLPAAWLARVGLVHGASYWVRTVQVTPGNLEAETRIEIFVPGKPRSEGKAELVVEVDPARYAYGLPLYLALLAASRSRRFAVRAACGYLVLLLPQAFSLAFAILKQIVAVGGGPIALGAAQWQLEAISLGYQSGALLVPALAPVILWLWIERAFLAAVVVDGWLRSSAPGTAAGAQADCTLR